MLFNELILKEKINSLDCDVYKYGKPLLDNLNKRGRKLVQDVSNKLDEKKPNNEKILTNERLRIKQALRDIKFENKVIGIIDTFKNNIIFIRDQYYQYTMQRIIKVWEKSVNPLFLKFAGVEMKFTKKEMATLKRTLFGMDINDIIRNLRDKTIFRFRTIILESYQSSEKKELKSIYKEKLNGAMNALMKSFRNIISGFCQVMYEQALTRFLIMING